jgi:tetratricopeptide (TPR) repeat protein
MKNFADAIPVLEKLIQLFSVPAVQRSLLIASDVDVKKEEVLLRLAFCFEQVGKYREGITNYIQVLALLPDCKDAVNGILRCIDRVDDSRFVVEKLVPLTRKSPTLTAFFFPLALHFHKLNDHTSSLKYVERVIQHHAENVRAYVLAIRWRMDAGENAEAERILSLAKQQNLNDYELHKCGLDLSLRKGDMPSAFRHLDLMTRTTDADLSPLRNRLSALATKMSQFAQ